MLEKQGFKFLFGILVFGLLAACGGGSIATQTNETVVIEEPKETPKALYLKYCKTCHGAEGDLNFSGAADLKVTEMTKPEVVYTIINGGEVMTGFQGIISTEDADRIAEYVLSDIKE